MSTEPKAVSEHAWQPIGTAPETLSPGGQEQRLYYTPTHATAEHRGASARALELAELQEDVVGWREKAARAEIDAAAACSRMRGQKAELRVALVEATARANELPGLTATLDEAVHLLHMVDNQEARHPNVAAFLDSLDSRNRRHVPDVRALELWAMDVIDGWAASHSGFSFITDTDFGDHDTEEPWLCHPVHNDRGKVPALFLRFAGRGDSAPAARIAAARALRAAHPELPEEPK